ncbi:MAG: FAD/NAD(P)-binding protein [Sedimentisphaerales bacterium]|nr:FAD/NAD(P)-binding protein [Sedimentisphaerales bacterium]
MCEGSGSQKDIYLPELATIRKKQKFTRLEMYYHVELDSEKELGHKAGQFVEVSIAGIGEAPISISSSPTQTGFELVVRNAGSVTNAIHNLDTGAKIGIRGPFGKGYPVDELKGKNIVFICGGLGLAPQRSFINYVLDNRDQYDDVEILLGTKCFEDRFYVDEITKWAQRSDVNFVETLDVGCDQWKGNVGVVTTIIPKVKTDLSKAHVLVCGPPIMYKFVLMSLAEAKVPKENIFVNLERRMKCGVGKCGHCQMNNQYVCQSGPVYRFSELGHVPEAI